MAHLHLTKELQLKTKTAVENEKIGGNLTNTKLSTNEKTTNDNTQNETISLPPQMSQFNERAKVVLRMSFK